MSGGAAAAGAPEGRAPAAAAGGPIRVVELGRRGYREALALQEDLLARVAAGEAPPTLLLVEHEPVITVGRGNQGGGAPALPPARPGVEVVRVARGGGVTYHGPGQLVGYPIVPVRGRDLHRHLRAIEAGLIRGLEAFGLRCVRHPGATGVWTAPPPAGRKIASIGIGCRRWVSFHGFALNVCADPAAFTGLAPCGFDAALMTSLEDTLSRPVSLREAREAVVPGVLAALGAGGDAPDAELPNPF